MYTHPQLNKTNKNYSIHNLHVSSGLDSCTLLSSRVNAVQLHYERVSRAMVFSDWEKAVYIQSSKSIAESDDLKDVKTMPGI